MKKITQVIRWFLRRPIVLFFISMLITALILFRGTIFEKEPTSLQTAKVERGTIISSVSASGKVLVTNIIPVTTQASGIVGQVFAREGDAIEKGEAILTIELDETGQLNQAQAYSSYLAALNLLDSVKQDKISAEKNLLEAKSKLITAQQAAKGTDGWDPTDVNKQKIDMDRKSAELSLQISQQKYDNYDQNITKAEIEVTKALLSYEKTLALVIAPASGILTKLSFFDGMNISSDSVSSLTIASIKIPGALAASFNLTEMDVTKVISGQRATIKLDAYLDKTYTGKVMSVDRVGVATNNVTSYPAIVRFDTQTPDIISNMTATASIILETKSDVLVIPSQAVQKRGDENYVRIIREGKQEEVTVEVGISSDTETEIVSGLNEGDEVVVGSYSTETGQGGTSIFGGGGRGGIPGGSVFLRR